MIFIFLIFVSNTVALPRNVFQRATIGEHQGSPQHQDYTLNLPENIEGHFNEKKDDFGFHHQSNHINIKKKKPEEKTANDYFNVLYSDYAQQMKEPPQSSHDYFNVHNTDHHLKKKKPPQNNHSNDYFNLHYSDYLELQFGKDIEGGGKLLYHYHFYTRIMRFSDNMII